MTPIGLVGMEELLRRRARFAAVRAGFTPGVAELFAEVNFIEAINQSVCRGSASYLKPS